MRGLLYIGAIIAVVAFAGSALAPDRTADSPAILGVETDVGPTQEPEGAETAPQGEDQPDDDLSPADEPTTAASPRLSPTETAGEWIETPDLPLPMGWGQVSVWTGSELMIWGGQANTGQEVRSSFSADGAMLDPGVARWLPIAESPVEGRAEASSAWTGSEVFIWGGRDAVSFREDGAAYDPNADSWRGLADSPLSPRSAAAAIWTGEEVLVLGGYDNAGPLGDAAAYDPVRDQWRVLENLPAELAQWSYVRHALAGDSAIVWGDTWEHSVSALRYFFESREWERLPQEGLGGQSVGHFIWSGADLYAIVDSSERLHIRVLRGGVGAWQALPDPPRLDPWGTTAVWSEHGLAVLTDSDAHWVFSENDQRWSRLPRGPRLQALPGEPVWTGSELLTWKAPFPGVASHQITRFRFADQPPMAQE